MKIEAIRIGRASVRMARPMRTAMRTAIHDSRITRLGVTSILLEVWDYPRVDRSRMDGEREP